MIRIRRSRPPAPQIDMAPLVDCVFLLLIFFLLASRFSRERGRIPESLAIELPGARSSAPAEEDAVRVFLSESGEVRLDGDVVPPGELEAALRRKAAERGLAKLLLVADRRVRLEDVTGAIDAARLAGFTAAAIATERGRLGGPGEKGASR